MISKGNTYTVFKPKDIMVKGEKGVKFSVGNSSFNKNSNSWENKGFINVVAITNQNISDRDKVKITEINSIDIVYIFTPTLSIQNQALTLISTNSFTLTIKSIKFTYLMGKLKNLKNFLNL